MVALAFGLAAASGPGDGESPFAGTLVGMQPFREASSVALGTAAAPFRRADLIDLNPATNAWFVLALDDGAGHRSDFHLENADPLRQRLRLDPADGGAIGIVVDGGATRCAPWTGERSELRRAGAAHLPFAPICGGRLYLRNPVRGARTELEAVTQFLRDHVRGGERIVGFVRKELYRDAFAERARAARAEGAFVDPPGAPPPARIRPEDASRAVVAENLGIDLGEANAGLRLGRWYAARGLDGVYVSAVDPGALGAEPNVPGAASWRPDAAEAQALDYLVAFDLAKLEVGFALGTDHPRLGWSARLRQDAGDRSAPGPDGVDTAVPLARTGTIRPPLASRAVATFAGGFKREHGAFLYGALAQRNHGSHYGFVEEGVVFSRLMPGLATLYVMDDGTVGMKTWTVRDEALLPRLRHARQNGVALLEPDAATGAPVPGALVNQWGAGNWSGSEEGKFRTLRAGACLAGSPHARYLMYGYFSTATPRTMAQVFQAYGCRYAMHLDMNALEHTYLALYTREDGRVGVEHLVRGMSVLDKASDGELVPRFLAAPDNRDFFYVLRRAPG